MGSNPQGVTTRAIPIADYTEPHLVLLRDLVPGGQMRERLPAGIREMAIERYKCHRAEISQTLGNLELAWHRGFHAGKDDRLHTDVVRRTADAPKRKRGTLTVGAATHVLATAAQRVCELDDKCRGSGDTSPYNRRRKAIRELRLAVSVWHNCNAAQVDPAER